MVGDKDEQLKLLIRDMMKMKPQAGEFNGLTEEMYDSVSLMQEDGSDELCDLNIPAGEMASASAPLPDDDDDILACKFKYLVIFRHSCNII